MATTVKVPKYVPPPSETARYPIEQRPAMVAAMKEAKVHPVVIQTFEATGLYLCNGWLSKMTEEEREEVDTVFDGFLPPLDPIRLKVALSLLIKNQFAKMPALDVISTLGVYVIQMSMAICDKQSEAKAFWAKIIADTDWETGEEQACQPEELPE